MNFRAAAMPDLNGSGRSALSAFFSMSRISCSRIPAARAHFRICLFCISFLPSFAPALMLRYIDIITHKAAESEDIALCKVFFT